jgi:hypothetical protein
MKMRVNQELVGSMRRYVTGTLLVTAIALCASCATVPKKEATEESKPNFSGVWKIRNFPQTEVYTIVQKGSDIQVVISIFNAVNDPNNRILDFTGKIDGQPHRSTILGQPATLISEWLDNKLVIQTIRGQSGETYAKRVLTMSEDGKTIAAERTSIASGGWTQSSTQIWDRQ